MHVLTDKLDVRAAIPANLTLVEFPRVESSAWRHYLAYVRKARAYFETVARSEGIDVVHQMNPVVRGLSLALLGKTTPIVLGTYVGDWLRLKTNQQQQPRTLPNQLRRLWKQVIDTVAQQFATKLMLASPNALQRVPLAWRVKSRIEYLPHGVDTDLYNPRPQPGDPEPRPASILYLGSFQQQKGVLDLIEAFATIAARIPQARLVMVGSGVCAPAMTARIESLGLSARVEFPGRATRSEVAGWLRACTLLCAPSHGEPYGQNVLEAMATGKPVVITNQGGHRYLSNELGKLSITPGDIPALAEALYAVLSDPDRTSSMGTANRSLAEEQHAWPRVVDRLEAIYHKAIASCPARPRKAEPAP
jgi:glycosyltransferase involved in cell wall biosynthesis